ADSTDGPAPAHGCPGDRSHAAPAPIGGPASGPPGPLRPHSTRLGGPPGTAGAGSPAAAQEDGGARREGRGAGGASGAPEERAAGGPAALAAVYDLGE